MFAAAAVAAVEVEEATWPQWDANTNTKIETEQIQIQKVLWIWGLITNLAEVNHKCCTYEYLYFSKSQTLVRIWVWLDFNNFHDIGSALRVWCCNSFEDTDLYYCWHFKSLVGHPPFWRVCWLLSKRKLTSEAMKEGGERWHFWDVVLSSILSRS